jgi:hypothetical protein
VHLFIDQHEIQLLDQNLCSSLKKNSPILSSFYEKFASTFNGTSICAPYLEALLSVKLISRAIVEDFNRIENKILLVEASNITLNDNVEEKGES